MFGLPDELEGGPRNSPAQNEFLFCVKKSSRQPSGAAPRIRTIRDLPTGEIEVNPRRAEADHPPCRSRRRCRIPGSTTTSRPATTPRPANNRTNNLDLCRSASFPQPQPTISPPPSNGPTRSRGGFSMSTNHFQNGDRDADAFTPVAKRPEARANYFPFPWWPVCRFGTRHVVRAFFPQSPPPRSSFKASADLCAGMGALLTADRPRCYNYYTNFTILNTYNNHLH